MAAKRKAKIESSGEAGGSTERDAKRVSCGTLRPPLDGADRATAALALYARGAMQTLTMPERPERPAPEPEKPREREDSEPELSAWMRAAQAGDADAYRALLTAIQPKVRAIVFSRIKADASAEDVVQNALLSIHRGRATYRSERPFGPWMRAIVRNAVTDYFRDRKRRGDREIPLPVEDWAKDVSGPDPAKVPLAPELQDALAGLPVKQREAVTLIQVEGLSVAEAALRAKVSVGAIKVRAHRGYRALRKKLEGARREGVWESSEPAAARSDDAKEGGS